MQHGQLMENLAYDIVIVGSGPAGLQAAIHAARSKVTVLLLGRKQRSSLYKAHIENYCCIQNVAGDELLAQGIEQAKNAGANFLHEDIIDISKKDQTFSIKTESGNYIETKALILAMGITRNKLGVKGEKELLHKGVSYCVDCDATFYKNQKVAVVGNASAAASGALTLLFYASEVHLISEKLEVTDTLVHQLNESEVILHIGEKVKEINSPEKLESVTLTNGDVIPVDGVFIELGAKGAIELASTLGVALDNEKFEYISTDKLQQTNVEGIFAAGDICGPPWQMAKAVGEGCVAGISAAKYVKKIK